MVRTAFIIVVFFSFFSPDIFGDSGRYFDIVKRYLFNPFAYLLCVWYLFRRPELMHKIFQRYKIILFVALLPLFSLLWTSDILETLQSSVNNIGYFLLAVSLVLAYKDDPASFFRLSVKMVLVFALLSVIVDATTSHAWIMGRYQGASSHPNSLGAICVFGVWCSLCLLRTARKAGRFLPLIALGFSLIAVWAADSMTSFCICLFILVLLPLSWHIFGTRRKNIAFIYLVGLIVAFSMLAFIIMAYFPEKLTAEAFFVALGRESNLTGRNLLWEQAIKAIDKQPLLGMGFDSLARYSEIYGLKYTQLHNGYLEVMVKGGAMAATLLLIVLFISALKFLKSVWNDHVTAVAYLILLSCICLHNITETSFYRPALLWLLTFIVMVQAQEMKRET